MPYLSLRSISASVLVTAASIFGFSGVAGAAPHDYCGDLKGTNTGKTCEIRLSDTGYSVDVTIPLNYPDQKSIAEYVAKTRDAFVNAAKSGAARSTTAQLSMKPTEYNSDLPPRGTQTVVFKVYQTGGNGQPQTAYKAFNWDQSYRKPVLYTVPKDDKDDAPLWRVDDPLKTVAPIVQAQLQQQLAPPPVATPPRPRPRGSRLPPHRPLLLPRRHRLPRRRCRSHRRRSTTPPTTRTSRCSTTVFGSSSTRARYCPTHMGRCRYWCRGRRLTR